MHTDCFALLDDASTPGAGSRLYTGLAAVLQCTEGQAWPELLEGLQDALHRGQYAVSVCSYELGAHLLAMPPRAAGINAPPLAQVLVFDHCTQLSQDEVAQWLDARVHADAAPAGVADIRANVDQAEFTRALDRIHDYIVAGDTYQVNYTYRLRFDAFGSPLALYARLRARQPVPYGALVMLPDGGALLSLSPELFVRHAQGELMARPMKGTAPAAPPEQTAENARRASALANDPKNRAENLMIVDLLRNDIGRIAVTGSVKVPALFEVTRYSSVLQMTSTVQARLRDDASLADVFLALYPCGSITGAPKRRTMEIIAELEPAPRGIYTGAIGWFDPPAAGATHAVGDFCMSVPIRTLALQPAGPDGIRRGEMGVGAGIVLDSDPHEEFAECQLKARFLTGLTNDFELFETLHASRTGGCRQQERHLARLAASCAYFGFAWSDSAARASLQAACAARPDDAPFRLRLALRQDGQFTTQSGALTALPDTVTILLAPDATTADDLFLRHKSSVRARYDAAWRAAEARGSFDMLFFNERGELTEGGRSNVFIRLDGRWHTPPRSCGLLPGVQRAAMLADPAWDAQETIITRAMLARAEAIVVCNALRGALPAHIIASA
ncbi:aminodeoxychorismate synthase component I [Janthinobacterium sp. SUN211]|uniref:aminodeoxychorismate synthase component I n=1 Tax=unclassified Janthinobacterium TaxID=2610881 RepID=UPI0027137253|nr:MULTISPECIES: aminodeoxychorismate synthase component I [unclassified Janthinobacterium]MDO8041592.1 aminodeoxychorismate synthase component I [Janthinobacterium sp. SUN137]MDO8049208.1 aminodeoxychorismate synthase component I [Janthinobacterium sp. SUN211]